MTNEQKLAAAEGIRNFRLPRYQEIPDVGLYLEQTTKYIAGFLDPVLEGSLTSSMINNQIIKSFGMSHFIFCMGFK